MFETKIPYPLSKKAKFCNSSQNFLHVNFPFLYFANFVRKNEKLGSSFSVHIVKHIL
jgi:hypothetical protein